MRAGIRRSMVLGVTALVAALVPQALAQPADATVAAAAAMDGTEASHPCQLETIAKGFQSGWGLDNPRSSGADFVIRDPDAWAAFWRIHTRESEPPPPVNFDRRVVIVAIQGPQRTIGGPNIAIVGVEQEGPFAQVMIIDDERPGPEEELTNPFHIVSTCRSELPPRSSVLFRHWRPVPESGTIVGHVFAARPDGEPIPLPRTHVALVREGAEPRHSVSGRDGSYFFVNVEPGHYVLLAEREGFEPFEQPIFVPPDTLVRQPIHLTPATPDFGAIVGRVLGARPDGEPFPLARALVQVIRGDELIARQLTGEEGGFRFHELRPGEYVVLASHEGFFPQEFVAVVEAGEVVEHVFVLEAMPHDPPGAFAGQVLGLYDEGETLPIRDALVRLFGPDGEVQRTWTDERGAFSMPRVPPGRYIAAAEADGWLPVEVEVEIRPEEVTYQRFVLRRR